MPHFAAVVGVISTEPVQAVFPERIRGKANPIAARRMAEIRAREQQKSSLSKQEY